MQRLRHFDSLVTSSWDGSAHSLTGCWVGVRDVRVITMSLSNMRVTQTQILLHHGGTDRFALAEIVVAALECLAGPQELIFLPYGWMAPHVGASFEAKSIGVEMPSGGPLKVTPGHRIEMVEALAWVRKTTITGSLPEPLEAASRGASALLRIDESGP